MNDEDDCKEAISRRYIRGNISVALYPTEPFVVSSFDIISSPFITAPWSPCHLGHLVTLVTVTIELFETLIKSQHDAARSFHSSPVQLADVQYHHLHLDASDDIVPIRTTISHD